MTGRHRTDPTDIDDDSSLIRQWILQLVEHWQIAVVVVLGVLALIFAAASASPAPTPPPVGLITSGAEAGVTAGTSS